MSRGAVGPTQGDDRLGAIDLLVGRDLQLVRSMARRAAHDPVEDPDAFWSTAADLAADLRTSVSAPPPSGLRLVRGLPADQDLPATPADSRRPAGRHVLLSELWLAVFGLCLGTPVAFRDQQGGALHQNVTPIPGLEDDESDVGSRRVLPLHTENPFHEMAPDLLLLFCLRPDPDGTAGTTLSAARDLVGRLDDRSVAALRRPIFAERGTTPSAVPPAPVLRGPRHDPLLRFDAAWTSSIEPEGAAALEVLASEIPGCTTTIRLRTGDLLIVDNRRWLHGRTPFRTSGDGCDRWLQRLYVCQEVARLEGPADRSDLVLAPTRESRCGDARPGDPGGERGSVGAHCP